MSLLHNEDFAVYNLRLGYLNHIHDGVGERLIHLDAAVLNNPAFRTAGWLPDTAAIKRCYSPPIPTGTSDFSNEYFQRPRPRAASGEGGEEGDGGGMVTGQGSEDTLGPTGMNERKRERRRRKEQVAEDDSSDLSDDSDEDAAGPAQSIKFSKMPLRRRAQSSPRTAKHAKVGFDVDDDDDEDGEDDVGGPALVVTSPSRPSEPTPTTAVTRIRSGSSGAVEAIKARARRDTATSSEVHSDLEEDDDEEDLDVGEASDLSDEFEGTADSPSMLGMGGLPGASEGSATSPIRPPPHMLPAISAGAHSPRKHKDALPRLPKLPPGQRPMSIAQPQSMISMMLKGSPSAADDKPFQRFAVLSGKDESNPLWIKIYAPFSAKPAQPIHVPLRRTKDDRPITVAELIGLSLWRYVEEDFQPALQPEEGNINHWTLRIVEDEEIDYDFPALVRTRPVVDFTSNNNRPPQRRARDKPWDEFGLVKATPEQFQENEQLTPQLDVTASTSTAPLFTPRSEMPPPKLPSIPSSKSTADAPPTPRRPSFNPARNPITGPSFAPSALRKDSSARLDLPQPATRSGASKTGAPRTVQVYHTDLQTFSTRTETYETTTDSYIAEIFEQSCLRLGLERALYVLKVHGTQTVAPPDRTIEALGEKLALDLVQRRFPGTGMGLSGSPGSSSPNAPLELIPANATPNNTHPSKRKGGNAMMKNFMHPLALQSSRHAAAGGAGGGSTFNLLYFNGSEGGKRYNVLRKQPLSFAATHPRTLIITPEYMTIMPSAANDGAAFAGKVTNVPMSSIIGAKCSRKHPKMVRILVYREKETKRYDFEAGSREEAEGVVGDVRRGMEAVNNMN